MKNIADIEKELKGLSDNEIANIVSDKMTEAKLYVYAYAVRDNRTVSIESIIELAERKEKAFLNPWKLELERRFGVRL